MRVAFVVGEFPSVSETFILQQITGILELGCDVRIFAAKPTAASVEHGLYERYSLRRHTTYRHPPQTRRAFWSDLGVGLRIIAPTTRSVWSDGQWSFISRAALGTKSLFRGADSVRHLFDLVRAGRFDIIHAHFGDNGLHCADLRAWDGQCRLVTSFHGYDANVAPNLAGRDLYAKLFETGDVFTVNSQFLKNRVIELGCAPERIEILPMGVDLEKFNFRPRAHDEGPIRLLTVGRLIEAKGIESAIRAVSELIARGHDVQYRIVGGGELFDSLQKLIQDLNISHRVQLLGPLTHERVLDAYYESHLFILPSIRTARGDEETQGVVVQEAQATGMPVIVSDIGGIREGIVDGDSGLCFQAGNATALADCIISLANQRDRWVKAGATGRALVESRYALKALNRQLLTLYEHLAEKTLSS